MTSDDLIRAHYRKQAEKDGDSPLSTIGERVVREKELALIERFLSALDLPHAATVLDAGCGNGHTLAHLAERFPSLRFHGLEFTDELLAIARHRGLEGVALVGGDLRATEYPDAHFDVVYTERCLINILDAGQQLAALREIGRILKPTGAYLMIECFTDGLANNNKARREMGLEEIEPAYHNLYFDKEKLLPALEGLFRVVDPAELEPEAEPPSLAANFLSSHFFVARILHPLLTQAEWVRNTEFVKFFSFLPAVGNYAPIQALILMKP